MLSFALFFLSNVCFAHGIIALQRLSCVYTGWHYVWFDKVLGRLDWITLFLFGVLVASVF